MRTVLLASLRHHTRRYVASAIAVVIGVGFVVATGMLTGATREGLTADAGAPTGGLDTVVTIDNNRQADRLLIEHRDVTRDDARLFQVAHAAQARRRRQPDLPGEIGQADAAVILQQRENLAVGVV